MHRDGRQGRQNVQLLFRSMYIAIPCLSCCMVSESVVLTSNLFSILKCLEIFYVYLSMTTKS